MVQSIEIVRGTSNKFKLTVTDVNANLYELKTGESIIFGVKAKLNDTDYVLLKKITGGTAGEFEIEIDPEDTEHVAPGKYFYDVGLKAGDEFYNVIPADTFIILPNVTSRG